MKKKDSFWERWEYSQQEFIKEHCREPDFWEHLNYHIKLYSFFWD